MRLHVGARTDTGRVRDLNEDVYLLRPEQGLFLVCDGMGGCPAGEVASEMAARSILEHVSAVAGEPAGTRRRTTIIFRRAGGCARQWSDRMSTFSTCAQRSIRSARAWARRSWAHGSAERLVSVAHVGDSRAYLWHRNRLECLTRDHSVRDGAARTRMCCSVRSAAKQPSTSTCASSPCSRTTTCCCAATA